LPKFHTSPAVGRSIDGGVRATSGASTRPMRAKLSQNSSYFPASRWERLCNSPAVRAASS
jgi:hypothetical protein